VIQWTAERQDDCTYRNVKVELSVGRRFQPRVQYDASELYFAAGLIDRSVGLHQHRVALMHVLELRGVFEGVAGEALHQESVVTRSRIADLQLSRTIAQSYGVARPRNA
jgi:hypothetical protein